MNAPPDPSPTAHRTRNAGCVTYIAAFFVAVVIGEHWPGPATTGGIIAAAGAALLLSIVAATRLLATNLPARATAPLIVACLAWVAVSVAIWATIPDATAAVGAIGGLALTGYLLRIR